MPTSIKSTPKLPVKVGSQAFVDDQARYFRWMHEHAPVCRAKVSVMSVVLVAGYEDCHALLKDSRIVRDRRKAGGKSQSPFPMPRSVKLMMSNMINVDNPEHRRQRTLVHKAFTPSALSKLEGRIEAITHELLDAMAKHDQVDLIQAYGLPIPVTVIREMLGVPADEMPSFIKSMRGMFRGYSLFSMLGILFFDMPRIIRVIERMVERKRREPEDDILTALINAEEAGDSLSRDELISTSFLLIVAGYETTVHLITNAVYTLLQHPEQLARLKADPELLEPTIEEVLRYAGPVQGTKPNFPTEPIVIHDVEIPRGTMLFPVLGAANRDPAVFERPDHFDISRPRIKHMGFGQGPHFCLGAALARLETKVALRNLFERFPDLRLAVPPEQLERQAMPLWNRFENLPVAL